MIDHRSQIIDVTLRCVPHSFRFELRPVNEKLKADHNSKMLEFFILLQPGHPCVLQSLVSELSPTQSAPPFAGAGFVQVLVLVWVPPPHSAEHSDQSPKSVYPPSTAPCY